MRNSRENQGTFFMDLFINETNSKYQSSLQSELAADPKVTAVAKQAAATSAARRPTDRHSHLCLFTLETNSYRRRSEKYINSSFGNIYRSSAFETNS